MSAERWAQLFVEKLLELTHKQWIFRNSKVHFKRADGLTENEHLSIFSKVENLMHTPSAELLPKHQHLLETDFESLGAGSTSARQFWIVSMESAISAAKMVSSGRVARTNGKVQHTATSTSDTRTLPQWIYHLPSHQQTSSCLSFPPCVIAYGCCG